MLDCIRSENDHPATNNVLYLSNFLKDKKQFVCLGCTLPVDCDETNPGCQYQIALSRKEYFSERHKKEYQKLPDQECRYPLCDQKQRGKMCKYHTKLVWQRAKKGTLKPRF